MKHKTWYVALDCPGRGWSMYVTAPSKKIVIGLARQQMGEDPNVIREVDQTVREIELQNENRELKSKLRDLLDKVEDLRRDLLDLTS